MLRHIRQRNGFVKGCEEVGVGGGDEILQPWRRVSAQIEDELLHAVVWTAHPAGRAVDISAKIPVCLHAAGCKPLLLQGPLM